jgi:hypothetical protein
MGTVDTLSFLLGTWSIERAIDDRRSGLRGTFVGTATLIALSADSDDECTPRARYEEAGELSFGAYKGLARRTLDYVRRNDGAVALRFGDGRPFVDVDLRDGVWQGVHPCREDRYDMTMIARSRNVVEERWQVRGPETDYDAYATLTRLPGTGPCADFSL